MDKWKDIELEKMKAGGNAKFRQFLESQEDYDPCWSLQDKYSSKAAALFRDKVRTRRQRCPGCSRRPPWRVLDWGPSVGCDTCPTSVRSPWPDRACGLGSSQPRGQVAVVRVGLPPQPRGVWHPDASVPLG